MAFISHIFAVAFQRQLPFGCNNRKTIITTYVKTMFSFKES